jgi:hypothetical protein
MGDVCFEKGSEGENVLRLRRPDSHPGWIPSSSGEGEPC